MSDPSILIAPFDVRGAPEQDFAPLLDLARRIRSERLPYDPSIPPAEQLQRWRSLPPFLEAFWFVARQAGKRAVIARGEIMVARLEENQHLGQFMIEVLPEYRRRGIARQLLVQIAGVAQREHKRLLVTETTERIPAGAAFMQRMGAGKGMEGHTNQLNLAELDRDLLRRWLDRSAELASTFEMGQWSGPYPEDQMDALVALHDVMNQQPHDNLELEDIHYTPEQIRQMEQANFANGTQRWTLYARERTSGALAGFTEVYSNPNRPTILQQGNTGVFPQYRNRGLGRWLKAAMLDRVLRERPEVQFVRTANADSNAAMLKINTELGFMPYQSQCLWQVETARVMGYLNSRRTPVPVGS